MNERVKDELAPSRIVPIADNTPSGSVRIDGLGVGLRIDPPHTNHGVETQARQVEWQNLEHFVPASAAHAVRIPDAAPAIPRREVESPKSDDWDQFTRQMYSQIQAQMSSLEQRERDLRLRLTRFDEEERSFRDFITSEQSQLEVRKNVLQRKESELDEQFNEFERRFRKFEAEREIVNHQRTELERRKHSLRDEVLVDLQAEKLEIEHAKSLTKQEFEQTKLLQQTLQNRLDGAAEENEKTLLAERETLWQSLNDEWEQRNLAFQRERDEWIRQRELEKSDFDREKMMFESSVESANAEFIRSRDALATEIAQSREALATEISLSRQQHVQTIDTEKQEWEQSRQRQESDLIVRSGEQRLESQRAREALALEIESERKRHDEILGAEKAEWDQIRLNEKAEIEAEQARVIAEREASMLELKAQRERHDTELAAERSAWVLFREQETSQYQAQHEQWLSSRDSMLEASRDALEVEFISLREQHAVQLQAEREEWEQTLLQQTAQLEERQGELLRERTLIENRIRFQQDHLDKSRADFEMAQNQYRRERQLEMQRLEDIGMQMIQRVRQIDLYRSSIDEREKSLDRELEIFNRTRKALSSTVDQDRLNLQAERYAWEQERQNQQNELRRQQEVLTTKAEGLESRRIRLDKLRAELEETHRATLEMRLALEEAWAQLTQVSGQEEARQRVDQVRQSLAGFYQQMHETLAIQRHEHLDAQAKFERQRAEFAEERQKLTSWFTSRDEELRLGEERLRISALESAEDHAKWRTARDRWLIEKAEAEQLIRRLLTSLGENNRELSDEMGTIRRLGEMNSSFDA